MLASISKYFVADGYFARQGFVKPLIEQTQLQVISKMRKDADLYYLYQGKIIQRKTPKALIILTKHKQI